MFRTSIVMKKGRLGLKLSVLCERASEDAIQALLFLETPTIGLRAYEVEKSELERDIVYFDFEDQRYRLKRVYFRGEALKYKLEYDDLKASASLRGEPLNSLIKRLEHALEAEELWKTL